MLFRSHEGISKSYIKNGNTDIAIEHIKIAAQLGSKESQKICKEINLKW